MKYNKKLLNFDVEYTVIYIFIKFYVYNIILYPNTTYNAAGSIVSVVIECVGTASVVRVVCECLCSVCE